MEPQSASLWLLPSDSNSALEGAQSESNLSSPDSLCKCEDSNPYILSSPGSVSSGGGMILCTHIYFINVLN